MCTKRLSTEELFQIFLWCFMRSSIQVTERTKRHLTFLLNDMKIMIYNFLCAQVTSVKPITK